MRVIVLAALVNACSTTLPVFYKPCGPTTIHNYTDREFPGEGSQREMDLKIYMKGVGLCLWNQKCLDKLLIRNQNDFTYICKPMERQ